MFIAVTLGYMITVTFATCGAVSTAIYLTGLSQQTTRLEFVSGLTAAAMPLAIAAIMLLFGKPITMLFISRDDLQLAMEAGETAYRYLSLMSVSLPILYILYVYMSALQGMGNTIAPMWSAAFELVVRLSVAFAVAQIGIRNGIFWAEVGAWYGGGATQALFYFLQMRKIKKQIK